MNKTERDDLIRLVRLRAKQARSDAETRAKILIAEIEDLMAAEFSARDDLWREALLIADEAVSKVNEQIAARCLDLGIPPRYAPRPSPRSPSSFAVTSPSARS